MAKLNSNSKSTQNPFQDTDFITEVIKSDAKVQSKSKESFKQFISKYYYKPKPQTLNFMSRIFKTISSHSTAFIIGLVIAGSAVGASAAQLVAPDALKPSTLIQELFKSNKQVERNPFTALKPDENNDVVKVDECDLAIKYPKQIKNVKIDSFEEDSTGNDYDGSIRGINLTNLPDLNVPYEKQVRLNDFRINCSDINSVSTERRPFLEIVNPEDMRKLTGWFITAESKVGTILTLKKEEGIVQSFIQYYFEYNKKFYEIQTTTEEIIKSQNYDKSYSDELLSAGGIYADQVQIQFNSLVPNEANTIPKKPVVKPVKNDNKQAIDIKLKNEAQLKKSVNNLDSVKDTQTFLCGVPNAITYEGGKVDEFNYYEAEMTIGNKKDYINDKNDNNNYNRVLTYIANPSDKLTDTVTGAFNTSCVGGANSQYVDDLAGVKYPNVDQFKVVLTREGQSYFNYATVRVYAKKGDNIITLRKTLTTYKENQKASDEYTAICPNDLPDYDASGARRAISAIEIECKKKQADYLAQYEKNQATPAKIAEAKIEAQKLVDMFAILN